MKKVVKIGRRDEARGTKITKKKERKGKKVFPRRREGHEEKKRADSVQRTERTKTFFNHR